MATVPRAVLDRVTEQVNALSSDAQERIMRVLESIEWTQENIAQCREIVLQALLVILPTYTDASAQAGADLYDAVRVAQVGEALGATAASGYDPDATEGAVRAFVQDIVDGKPVTQFNSKVADRVDYEVRRAANMSVAENATRDPLKPRYARVPTGAETCGFCLMLASRGFVYTSAEAASHAHANCDCRVIQGYEGMEVEGYDPDALYRQWRRIEEADVFAEEMYSGNASKVAEDRAVIEKGFTAAWREYRATGNFDSTVNAYLATLQGDGVMSSEQGDKLWGKEAQLGSWISSCGHEVTFKQPKGTLGSKSADMYVDGELWEAKRVTSKSRKKLRRRVSEASEQSSSVIIDLSENDSMDMQSAKRAVADMLEDDAIDRIMIVSGGRAEIMSK